MFGGELGLTRRDVEGRPGRMDSNCERRALLRVLEGGGRVPEPPVGIAPPCERQLEQDLSQLLAGTRELDEPVEQLAGMVGVAGREMAARGLETSTPSRGTFTRRCDSGRLLQQPAGRVERTARPRRGRRGLDLRGDGRAGTARGEREVRSPFLRALESASRAARVRHGAAPAWRLRIQPLRSVDA